MLMLGYLGYFLITFEEATGFYYKFFLNNRTKFNKENNWHLLMKYQISDPSQIATLLLLSVH